MPIANQTATLGFPTIAASHKGSVYVAWLDERDHPQPEGSSSVYLTRSTDRGATFSPNLKIAPAACPCCRPQLYVASNGEIYLAWRKVFNGDVQDMVIARSNDGGKMFSQPVRVAVDNWVLHACPDVGPAIAVNDGVLYVAWYSGDVLDTNHPRLSVSEDGRVLLVFQGRPLHDTTTWRSNQVYLLEIKGDNAVGKFR